MRSEERGKQLTAHITRQDFTDCLQVSSLRTPFVVSQQLTLQSLPFHNRNKFALRALFRPQSQES